MSRFWILVVENPGRGHKQRRSTLKTSPLIEAMPLTGLLQDAEMVQILWMAVGSVEDWGLVGLRATFRS